MKIKINFFKDILLILMLSYFITEYIVSFTGAHSDKFMYIKYFNWFQHSFVETGSGFIFDSITYLLMKVLGHGESVYFAFNLMCVFLFLYYFKSLPYFYLVIICLMLFTQVPTNLFGNVLKHSLAAGIILCGLKIRGLLQWFIVGAALIVHLSSIIYLPIIIFSKMTNKLFLFSSSLLSFLAFISYFLPLASSVFDFSVGKIILEMIMDVFRGLTNRSINNLYATSPYVMYRFYSIFIFFMTVYWMLYIFGVRVPVGKLQKDHIQHAFIGNLMGIILYNLMYGVGTSGRILLVPIFINSFLFVYVAQAILINIFRNIKSKNLHQS